MTSNIIVLESELAKMGQSQDFTITMNPPLILNGDSDYEIALVNAGMWYSWHNISDKLQNNVVRFWGPDMAYHTFTIPNGIYDINTLNQAFYDGMKAIQNSFPLLDPDMFVYTDSKGKERPRIFFTANTATMHFVVNVIQKYQKPTGLNDPETMHLDLLNAPYSNIRLLLGFNTGRYYLSETEATNSSNIENDVESIHIHCSLCSNSFVNGSSSDVIYSYIVDGGVGMQLAIKPYIPLYTPLSQKNISSIRMYLTNQSGTPILLNNEPVSYTLSIRKV